MSIDKFDPDYLRLRPEDMNPASVLGPSELGRGQARSEGRPPHTPTDQQRATVKTMAGYGIPQHDIARVIGIHDESLRKHYRDELDLGLILANAKVAETLFRQATKEGNTTAAIWWTKSRMGWKEKTEIAHTDANGGSLVLAFVAPPKRDAD